MRPGLFEDLPVTTAQREKLAGLVALPPADITRIQGQFHPETDDLLGVWVHTTFGGTPAWFPYEVIA